MLHLVSKTDPDWGRWAAEFIGEILLDHAHCEKKAASTALSLIFRYPEFPQLARPLSEVAREELEHFELVLTQLQRRGESFRRQSPSPYAGRLLKIVRTGEPDRLVDTLLCCAAIEARSCERMKLLAEADLEPELSEMYGGLLESEARHHCLYVDLAATVMAREAVRVRLEEVMNHESEILFLAPSVPRMHN